MHTDESSGCNVQGRVGLERNLISTEARAREVRVIKVRNGYVVYVGCLTLIYETIEKLIAELTRYLLNPAEVEKEYLSDKGGAK